MTHFLFRIFLAKVHDLCFCSSISCSSWVWFLPYCPTFCESMAGQRATCLLACWSTSIYREPWDILFISLKKSLIDFHKQQWFLSGRFQIFVDTILKETNIWNLKRLKLLIVRKIYQRILWWNEQILSRLSIYRSWPIPILIPMGNS